MCAPHYTAASPYAFGEKIARSFVDDYKEQFKDTYGIDPRLPTSSNALRQTLIAAAVGAGMYGARGLLWPGHREKVLDKDKNIVQKKPNNPFVGMLTGAALGGASSALANYAGQTLAQYNPEIDKLMSTGKQTMLSLLPIGVKNIYTGVDASQTMLDRAGRMT